MNYEQLLAQLKRDLPNMDYQKLAEQLRGDIGTPTHPAVYWIVFGLLAILAIIVAIWILNAIYQVYNVWASRKEGEAELAQANKEQLIQVSRAEGRLRAADLNKQAAIVEAEAVAAQIEKIGQNLKQHDLYLKWQWIKMMEERPDSSTIYVPTEAGLPILEAGKRKESTPVVQDEDEE